MVRVTHPYHPLCGRQYQLITHRKNWGEDRVYFEDEAGRLVRSPALWTDPFGRDPVEEVAAGRAHFRPADLLGAPLFCFTRCQASSKFLRW